jgi:pimeloyl-ACP methyl ester carboxylesterase
MQEEVNMQNTRSLLIVSVIILSFLCAGCTPFKSHTPPISTSNPVAILEPVTLGGMEQWVLIRGEDRSTPVLLWLHGGPGSAQMPIVHAFNSDLEKDFIVVHWDQRGAGKSNPRDFDESTMTIERYIEDAHQLTLYLKDQYDQEKIYLLGHSWGTQFGILLAQTYPEDYHAYIGVSQVIDPLRNGDLAYPWLTAQVEAGSSQKDQQALQEIGSPPFIEHDRYVSFAKMVEAYGGGTDIPFGKQLQAALAAPEYTLRDYAAWFKGANRGSGPMWDSTLDFNLLQDVPCLNLPVYFLMGVNDHNTDPRLVQEYLNSLDAPQGKELILFEDSAHTPFLNQPDAFHQALRRIKQETQP